MTEENFLWTMRICVVALTVTLIGAVIVTTALSIVDYFS
jgi:hypothetical protein